MLLSGEEPKKDSLLEVLAAGAVADREGDVEDPDWALLPPEEEEEVALTLLAEPCEP